MTLLIIRHGESEADILNVHEGRADFELTPLGHRQAEAMAAYVVENYGVSRIYSSTLRRARQTAEHLHAACGATVIEDEMLMEFNNGLIAGLARDEAARKYPFVEVPPHSAVYGQESKLEFRFRADFVLSKIISETAEDGTAAIVTHGGMINQLYGSFLRLPFDSGVFFSTGDAGIHEWRIDGGKRRIVFSNMTVL